MSFVLLALTTTKMLLLTLVGSLTVISGCLATIPRPRGVAISMASMYRPDVPFKCLDGSKEVPFNYVNDDYCDCEDGSDEPGTSACPGGKFHCTNAGYKPMNILSSRVGDGICDCCDGTDEWEGSIDCVNNCKELGKKMREEADQARQLQDQGYKTKLAYIEEGKKTRQEKKAQLEQLDQLKVELDSVKTEMEAKKNDAEAPEKEAKDKHEQAWNVEVEKRKADKEALRAQIAFIELDTNQDKRIDLAEVKGHIQFDVDSNGEVSDDEAKEHLEGEDHCDLDHFTLKVWPNIKQFYKPPGSNEASKGDNLDEPEILEVSDRPKFRKGHVPPRSKHRKHLQTIQKTATPENIPLPVDDDDEEEYEEHNEDFDSDVKSTTADVTGTIPKLIIPSQEEDNADDDDDEDGEEGDGEEENTTEEADEKMPEYDDQTKLLISAADEARRQFTEAEGKLKDTENEIKNLNSYLNNDYGPEEEYSALKGNCYEYTDREYTYKLCAFDRASQRPKSGGSETNLGNWGHWDGAADDKYSAQKYDNGQNCWNGPNRSVRVIMKCGLENKVISASEPSRCEYQFEFVTPSRCGAPAGGSDDIHDEL